MEKKRILIDKAEIILFVSEGNSIATYNLVSSDFNRIQFDKCIERKFGIIPQASEKIMLSSSKLPGIIEFTKGKYPKFFDTYKEELRQYANDYRITFADKTQDS